MDIQENGFERADWVLRYLKGELLGEELEAFHRWLAEDPENQKLLERLQDPDWLQSKLEWMGRLDTDAAWKKVAQRTTERKGGVLSLGRRFLPYAAAVLLLASGLAVVYWPARTERQQAVIQKQPTPVASTPLPGGEQAKLVLADGSVLLLDGASNGTLHNTGGIKVAKRNGEITYEVLPTEAAGGAMAFNTLSTPAGGQFSIVLPDGSKAWLNAASSLRFPTAFRGAERKVELTGEAYFEIVHNAKVPFRVKTRGTEIEVLGTHFNVMAYDNEEAVRTTLVQGAVKVRLGTDSRLLRPGEQAAVREDRIQVAPADVEEAVAWKEGRFQFRETDLPTIMRQMERWYGVEVQYEGDMKEERFSGTIPRSASASQLLEMLALTHTVRFSMEGKKITVRPYN